MTALERLVEVSMPVDVLNSYELEGIDDYREKYDANGIRSCSCPCPKKVEIIYAGGWIAFSPIL